VKQSPGKVVSIGCSKGGINWNHETAVLLCADTVMMIAQFGMIEARRIATYMRQFTLMKKEHPEWSRTIIMEEWDKHCHATFDEPLWKDLSEQQIAIIYQGFLITRFNCDVQDKRTVEQEEAYCNHCVDLYTQQRGRCAITGMPFSTTDKKLRPSPDRIRLDIGHVEGNIMLTCWSINISRRMQSEGDFLELMWDATK
jgi:hypothetical protein